MTVVRRRKEGEAPAPTAEGDRTAVSVRRGRKPAPARGAPFVTPTPGKTFTAVPDWLAAREELDLGPKFAYARLARYGMKNGVAAVFQRTLAGEIQMSITTTRRYLKDLESHRLIEVTQRGFGWPNQVRFLDHEWMHVPSDGSADPTMSGHMDDDDSAPSHLSENGPSHPSTDVSASARPRTNRRDKQETSEETTTTRRRAATSREDEAIRQSQAAGRKSAAEADEVAARLGTSGRGLALRLQGALAANSDVRGSAQIVDVGALAKQLNQQHRAGTTRTVQQQMVELYARNPHRYTGQDAVKGWIGFLAALPKLEADAGKHARVEQGGKRYGGAYAGVSE